MSGGIPYVVLHEAAEPPPGYARGGGSYKDHTHIASAINAQDAVRQAIDRFDHWSDGSLWAVRMDNLERVRVEKRYDFKVGNSS